MPGFDSSSKTWTFEGISMQYELELIDDAFCDIIQDQYRHLSPEVERSLKNAIDRLRAWRERYGMTYPIGGAN